MARRVFFSFDYRHVWKVNQIRSMPNIIGTAVAGFQDASLWEESKKKSDRTIKDLIDNALVNTSVTIVCVTRGTANRKFINYEIDKSLEMGKGLVAVQIHNLRKQYGNAGPPGAIPAQIRANGFEAYKYSNKEALERWTERAAVAVGR